MQNTDGIATLNPFRYRSYYFDEETGLYYLQSRYYDAELGRFISADSIEYLDPETIGGLNLYAYCGNNPVMGYDPEGTWNWGHFWKILGAIAVVALVTVATVITCGAVAAALGASTAVITAVVTGAAVGGLVAGAGEIIGQCVTKGIDNLDITSVAIETFTGSVFGALTGAAGATTSASVRATMRVGRILLSGVNAVMHGKHEGLSNDQINKNAAGAMLITTGFQLIGLSFDRHTGKVFTEVLQSMKIDGALGFGIKGLLQIGAITSMKSVWRTHKEATMEIISPILSNLWRKICNFLGI